MLRRLPTIDVYVATIEVNESIFTPRKITDYFNTKDEADFFIKQSKEKYAGKISSSDVTQENVVEENNQLFLVNKTPLIRAGLIYLGGDDEHSTFYKKEFNHHVIDTFEDAQINHGNKYSFYYFFVTNIHSHFNDSFKRTLLVHDGHLYNAEILNESITINTEYATAVKHEKLLDAKRNAEAQLAQAKEALTKAQADVQNAQVELERAQVELDNESSEIESNRPRV
jgi:hypothetical protein